ncbi:MAG: hypothetical protein KDE48_00295 [Anaerolineales bacterium]|nr:hypothetical protein [Anaerolineales bacterium]
MKITRQDYKFKEPRICHIYPKRTELDRLLVNLYMLLKYGGRVPVSRTGRREVTIDWIVEELIHQHSDTLQGFADNADLIADWLYSDLIDVINKGNPDKEKVAAPLPLHLNVYKLRNPKQTNRFGGDEQLYSMMQAGDPDYLVNRLASFLGQGMETNLDTYDEETPLDLDTLVIVRMVDNEKLKEGHSSRGNTLEPPLCKGQARLLCDDLQRLLVYENHVPRSVLITYIRTIMGLHLGLYLLRLFHQLTGWMYQKQANPACLECPVEPARQENPFHKCPYAMQSDSPANTALPEILIDMGDDHTSHMARLSQENCARHYASMNEYIRTVFAINQLFQFAESQTGRRELNHQPNSVADVLKVLASPPPGFDYYFDNRIGNLFPDESNEEESPEIIAIRDMENLSPMDTFVELVALKRTDYYRRHLTQQLDSLFMKNSESCLIVQGKGKNNQRRWYISSHLLEVLVQIAVLDITSKNGKKAFYSRPILIDEFVTWLKDRYGFTIVPNWPDASIKDYEAFNTNMRHLKDRLREIGFYTDLSDAYNAQKIRPRYEIKRS